MARSKRPRKKRRNRRPGAWSGDDIPGGWEPAPHKMSTVLLDFIRPYRELAGAPELIRSLVAVGAVAWNLALLPEQERESALAEAVTKAIGGSSLVGRLAAKLRAGIAGDPPGLADFKRIVRELVERKLRYFAGNRRFILSYEILEAEDELRLVVASTVTPATEPSHE